MAKETKKEETKVLTTAEKIAALKGQQEQLREAFLKVQGAIELLESMEEEEKKKAKEIFKQSFDAFSNYIELAPLVTESNNVTYEISPPKFYYRVLFDEGKYEYTKSQAFLDRAIVNSYAGLKKSKSFCSDLKESKKLGNIQATGLVRLNCWEY